LSQVLLDFGQELEQRPIHPDDVPAASEPEYELRRVADCHKNVTLIPANADKL
jgi:hypothetical protein